jgi:hypothetical protein
MNQWSQKRTNTASERQTKSIPCHVQEVNKDFIVVAFEPQNGVFTPPTVKIPQSMSPYGRDPTQKGDKGFASPSDYYLGGVTGDAGGNTSFYPRGNLTAMSFQPVSHKQNPDRDYDQLTHMGGPNGWIVGSHQGQSQDQGQGNGTSASSGIGSVGTASAAVRSMRTAFRTTESFRRAQQKNMKDAGGIIGGIGGIISGIPGAGGIGGIVSSVGGAISSITGALGGQNGQQKDKTQFSFDKEFKAIVQSVDEKHNLIVDQKNKNVGLTSSQTIYHDPNDGKVYLGGKDSSGMARVMTEKGPSKNTYAKVG